MSSPIHQYPELRDHPLVRDTAGHWEGRDQFELHSLPFLSFLEPVYQKWINCRQDVHLPTGLLNETPLVDCGRGRHRGIRPHLIRRYASKGQKGQKKGSQSACFLSNLRQPSIRCSRNGYCFPAPAATGAGPESRNSR